jgi:hypothetical protein
MKLKNLEDVLHKAPFVPFGIQIDGRSIHVEHPDQVLFSHDRSTVVVAPGDNRLHIIEVANIEFLSNRLRGRTAK